MTINQALDQIFVSYPNERIKKFSDIQKLKENLTELKTKFGGNMKLGNTTEVQKTIKYGSVNPDNWEG